MATLILTTLGTALGGPVGGAIGSIVGQSIDRNLFGPPARRGPRLGDLGVQTSSYGTPIARIYGRMRVAGSVIWATDLREEEVASNGGKGSPATINYSYSASFAVALSSRAAGSVARIWADGKLLRGSDGLFKSKTKYRFYPGSETQLVDPLIAAVEGVGHSTAFRGIAYAVFEDMQLADYGNRIPSLTFELIADEAAPRVAAVVSDISRGVIEEGSGDATLGGFAALGNDRRSAVEPLVELWGGTYHDDGSKVRAAGSDQPALTIGDIAHAGCVLDEDKWVPRVEREQEAAEALPASLTIEYYDAERDYQAGRMQASLLSGGRSQRRIDSAAVISAGVAKSLASDTLARRWAGRDRVTLRLSPFYLGLRPGQFVTLLGVPGRYQVERVTLDGLVAVVGAHRIPSAPSQLAADPGRSNADPDLSIAPTLPLLLDMPSMGMGDERFGVTVALGSYGRFRPTTIVMEANGQPLCSLRMERAAITGLTASILPGGPSTIIDRKSAVDVVLTNKQALLFNADDDALAMGANAMLIGEEIVQFARATVIREGVYRLSGLARGCRGTEWAMDSHVAGERAILLEQSSLSRVELDLAMIGAEVQARAYGLADDEAQPPQSTIVADGENLRPMSPCHFEVSSSAAAYSLRWVARRRGSSGWSVSAEESVPANYQIDVRRSGNGMTLNTSDTSVVIPAAQLAALGTGPMTFEVRQLGALPSRPAVRTLDA